jgi:hypothetical protein
MNGWSSGPRTAPCRLVLYGVLYITLYNDAKLEDGMLRAGAMIALLGVAVICAGCSKCASPFGHPGACHSDGPSLG